jgi:glycosyltransferase involved in cell wall biosynthesis
MVKLALNFICKNESHVIERMLKSAIGVADMVVCVDTGSTDNTKELIENFCKTNNIECHIFDRAFDTFNNSRNYAISKLKEIVNNSTEWYGFWFDCDEELIVDKSFNKQSMNKDLYMLNTFIGKMKYTRNTFFRCSEPFEFYGPIHEFIICKNENITSDIINGITVNVSMDGNSWKGDIHKKYYEHAQILEKYIQYEDFTSRWVFYTAQSYHDSATIQGNKFENDERLRRSVKYYRDRINRIDGYDEERYYSQYRLSICMLRLDYPWKDVHTELLKAYKIDPVRGEQHKVLIEYYSSMGEWEMAYMYSKFAVANYHKKNPYPSKLLFIEEEIYNYKFLDMHVGCCVNTNRMEEAKVTFNELLTILNTNPHWFSDEDKRLIEHNRKIFKI